MRSQVHEQWADHFGLAQVPLFQSEALSDGTTHSVLLDGGFGSFAVSVANDEIWRVKKTASWAWSSNLPHHVTITDNKVAVTRWDNPSVEVLSRTSVESKLDAFYQFLRADRVRSNQTVVERSLTLFRQVRSLVSAAQLPDEMSVKAFLYVLDLLIARSEPNSLGSREDVAARKSAFYPKLPTAAVEQLVRDILGDSSELRLHPELAVRHAGSAIFQEAHFALLRAPMADLFGYAGVAAATKTTRGGAHFTPAPLARTVVEQAIAKLDGFQKKSRLVVTDPACGSGAFLHEAMRTLRRLGFAGKITIVGRDISAAAIDMAEFVLRQTAAEWQPDGGLSIDLQCSDSLQGGLPASDLILMNPPFISWSSLTSMQRDQMREVLGNRLSGRGDMSMAFITKAIDSLAPGGALGALFPASLLTLQSAAPWREDLLVKADMRLLASLGDYALFAHAMVQVAAAVFTRPADATSRSDTTLALVTANQPDATGDALRGLRRSARLVGEAGDQAAWRLFEVPAVSFRSAATWRLLSPSARRAMESIAELGTSTIGAVFDVRQGVRSGNNKAFVLDDSEYGKLPTSERRYFRQAVMGDSIRDGKICQKYWIFYPYGSQVDPINDENQLRKRVRSYAERHLLQYKDELERRSGIAGLEGSKWWDLTRSRSTWALEKQPRLISKYFAGPGGFVLDVEADVIVVQGFAWILKSGPEEEEDIGATDPMKILAGYAAIFNSQAFNTILGFYSPHVAGGQFDLSQRYTSSVPIPDLVELLRDERAGSVVTQLVRLGCDMRPSDPEWMRSVDSLTQKLYGSEAFRGLVEA